MSPRKKVDFVLTIWHLRVCRRCFLRLEKRKITQELVFRHGKMTNKVDRFCLNFLGNTLGCSIKNVVDGPSLSAFLTDVKEIMNLMRQK